MDTVESVEVELALTHAGTFRTRAVFVSPARISVGTAEQATLRIEDASLPSEHDFLEFVDEGVRLILLPSMTLELIIDNERKSLDTLRLEGCVSDEGGLSSVRFPIGANAVLTLGSISVMMKCREASDPSSHVKAAGSGEFVCGNCGSDLQLVLRHPLALSSCPRCQFRNRLTLEEDEEAYSGKFGPDGTDADVPLTALVTSFDKDQSRTGQQAEETQGQREAQQEEEAEDGPTDQGLSDELSGIPGDFEEEATQPSLSVRGSDLRRGETKRAERKKVSPLGAENGGGGNELREETDAQPPAKTRSKRRRRRRKRPVEALWTPKLLALAAVGIVSGAIGLTLIFYAVFAG